MADVQLENGFTKIANEIFYALAHYRINGESMQVLMVILQKTYGWNKKEDAISFTQFEEYTGLKRQNIGRALKWLIDRKIITKTKRYVSIYSFNKNYDEWILSPMSSLTDDTSITDDNDKTIITDDSQILSPMMQDIITDDANSLSPMIHTKEINKYTKEKEQKKGKSEEIVDYDEFEKICSETLKAD